MAKNRKKEVKEPEEKKPTRKVEYGKGRIRELVIYDINTDRFVHQISCGTKDIMFESSFTVYTVSVFDDHESEEFKYMQNNALKTLSDRLKEQGISYHQLVHLPMPNGIHKGRYLD